MASIRRIDHVAIAVRDCDQATEQYRKLLNARHIRTGRCSLPARLGPAPVGGLGPRFAISAPRKPGRPGCA